MLRSMYSAISGMNAFQTELDVVGNNIANVDTVGFKASRTEFSDILSQTLSNASNPGPTAGVGGTNSQQVGLGVNISAIYTPFTQGADQETGVPTDVALNGDGFFLVSNNIQSSEPAPGSADDAVVTQTNTVGTGAVGGTASPVFYTRNGQFSVDANGNIVLPDGSKLLGNVYNASGGTQPPTVASPTSLNAVNVNIRDAAGQVVQGQFTISPQGQITVTDPTNGQYVETWSVPLANFSNPSGLNKVGDNLYAATPNSGNAYAAVGAAPPTAYIGTAGVNGFASMQVGALEASNVNLTNEFSNMIVAQQAFDANSKVINTDNNILTTVLGLENQA
ncbi:MAG: flagellar hook-basal body complex protein [Firmicutes bacterium]|nr:flagellar hook-basal body complex protein [Bacillota bacterium]